MVEKPKCVVRFDFPIIFGKAITDALQRSFERTDIVASCLTCRNYVANSYTCNLYGIIPPHVFANSCVVSYKDTDDVPF